MPKKMFKREKSEYEQKLLDLARVTRVVKGGRRFRFRATLAIGNKNGKVGLGVAKGSDVSDAIGKAYTQAKKDIIVVNRWESTIPHDITSKFGSAKILLKPAREGKGLVAGGTIRVMAELAGIRDIVSKSFGTSNKINVAKAALKAFSLLKKRRARSSVRQKEEVLISEPAVIVEKQSVISKQSM